MRIFDKNSNMRQIYVSMAEAMTREKKYYIQHIKNKLKLTSSFKKRLESPPILKKLTEWIVDEKFKGII